MENLKNAKDLKPGDKIYYYHGGKVYERTIAEINWDQDYIVCYDKNGNLPNKRLRLYDSYDNENVLYVQYTKHYACRESIEKGLRDSIDRELTQVDNFKKKMEFHRKRAFNKVYALNRFVDKK